MINWNNFIGKTVFVQLKSRRFYSGKVIAVSDENGSFFITLIDKFNKQVVFQHTEIEVIEEEAVKKEI